MDAHAIAANTKWCETCAVRYSEDTVVCPKHGSVLLRIERTLAPGDRIDGKFDIIEIISSGAWGTVYRARREDLDREVAVKVLHHHLSESSETSKRFLREARALNSLRHENLARLLTFGKFDNGQSYFVMDFIDGKSLESLVDDSGGLTAEMAIAIFIQICDVLDAVHAAGVLHRDIKPGNIILSGTDANLHATLVDFGLVSFDRSNALMTSKLTKTGLTIGTPATMSPEQCKALKLDPRSDLYSLGAAMYQAVTGKPPFSAASFLQLMAKHISELPEEPIIKCLDDSVGLALAGCIMQCLEKEPKDRPSSALELREMLQAALKGEYTAKSKVNEKIGASQAPVTTSFDVAALLVTVVCLLMLGLLGLSTPYPQQFLELISHRSPQRESRIQFDAQVVSIQPAGSESDTILISLITPDGKLQRLPADAKLLKGRRVAYRESYLHLLQVGNQGTVILEPSGDRIHSIRFSEQSSDPPARAAQDQLRAIFEVLSMERGSGIHSWPLPGLGRSFQMKSRAQLQNLLDLSNLREASDQRIHTSDEDGEADPIVRFCSTPFLESPYAVKLLRQSKEGIYFLLDKSAFYVNAKGYLRIQMVPGKEEGQWLLEEVSPASQAEWDSI